MRAVQAGLVEPRKFELIETDLSPGPGEVLIEIAACGICSSEIPRYTGEEMSDPPVFLGHEPSGVVVEVGGGVSEFEEGDRVTGAISAGFATHSVAPREGLLAVPDGVDLMHAIGEPLMCISNIARAAAPKFGDHVAVVGCGQMGLLTIAALKQVGLGSLIAVDRIGRQLDLALQIGATHTVGAGGQDPVATVAAIAPCGADVVVELTGKPGGLELSAELIRMGQATLVMAGFHQTRDAYYLRQFAFKGLVAHQAHPHYSPDVMADYARALAALARGAFPMDLVVTEQFPLDRIADGFEALISHREGFLKGIVVPGK